MSIRIGCTEATNDQGEVSSTISSSSNSDSEVDQVESKSAKAKKKKRTGSSKCAEAAKDSAKEPLAKDKDNKESETEKPGNNHFVSIVVELVHFIHCVPKPEVTFRTNTILTSGAQLHNSSILRWF